MGNQLNEREQAEKAIINLEKENRIDQRRIIFLSSEISELENKILKLQKEGKFEDQAEKLIGDLEDMNERKKTIEKRVDDRKTQIRDVRELMDAGDIIKQHFLMEKLREKLEKDLGEAEEFLNDNVVGDIMSEYLESFSIADLTVDEQKFKQFNVTEYSKVIDEVMRKNKRKPNVPLSVLFRERGTNFEQLGRFEESFHDNLLSFEFDKLNSKEAIKSLKRSFTILLGRTVEEMSQKKDYYWVNKNYFEEDEMIQKGIIEENELERCKDNLLKTLRKNFNEFYLKFLEKNNDVNQMVPFPYSEHITNRTTEEILKLSNAGYSVKNSFFDSMFKVFDDDDDDDDDNNNNDQSKSSYLGVLLREKKIGFGMEFKVKYKGVIFNRTKFYHRTFFGNFCDGKKEGKGFIFDSTSQRRIFEGMFSNDEKEGKGVVYTHWGPKNLSYKTFEGNFRSGKRNGRGESHHPTTGVVTRGTWNNGLLDESSVFKFDCPVIPYSQIRKQLQDSKICGKGGNGVVYEVKTSSIPFLRKKNTRDKNMGTNIAVKIMKCKSYIEKKMINQMIRRGIGCAFSVKSKHILESYGIVEGATEVGYMMPLCDKSIDDIIDEGKTNLEEKLRILRETAEGMNGLHRNFLIHRDLKWGNVMLDFKGVVKILDFDTLKEDEIQWRIKQLSQSSRIGTQGFRPPEVYIGKKFTLKCDVFAFGLMIYALLWEKKFPYSTQFQCSNCRKKLTDIIGSNSLEEHVTYCNLRPILLQEEVRKFPQFLIDIMIQCWDMNPFNRPSFEEIIMRFDSQSRRQFCQITLQFPTHKGVDDQKMFMKKPFEIWKINDWIEKKFKAPLEGSVYFEDEETEEIEGEEEKIKRTSVVLIVHHIIGTVSEDEDLLKVIQNNENPVLQVSLNYVNQSYVVNTVNRKITFEEYMEKEQELEVLKEENKILEVENERITLESERKVNELRKECDSKDKKLKEITEKFQEDLEILKERILQLELELGEKMTKIIEPVEDKEVE